MKIKQNVKLSGASFQIGYACAIAEAVLSTIAPSVPFVVTSAKDGVHGLGSLHGTGHAVDVRTRELTRPQRETFSSRVRAALDPHGFDVVLESDHLHVEFDPKPGEKFAEVTA